MLLFGIAFAYPQESSATTKYKIDLPKTFWIGQDEEWLRLVDQDDGIVYIDGIKQSKKGVFSITKEDYLDENDNTHYDIYVKPAKAGKTKLTVNYSDVEGTQGTVSASFKVKKYPNEIKKLVVNGRSIKIGKKAKNRFGCRVKTKGTRTSIMLKPSKGWKITSVSSVLSRGEDDDIRSYKSVTKKKITKKTVSRGKKVKFPKDWVVLNVCVTMTNKNQETIDYNVTFYRD